MFQGGRCGCEHIPGSVRAVADLSRIQDAPPRTKQGRDQKHRAVAANEDRGFRAMKHTGIRVSDIDIKDGKVVPKRKYRSVSQKIAERKKPKRKYKRGK